MKCTLIIAIAASLTLQHAQAWNPSNEDERFILVTGSAEVVVQPDEIELEIILKEFGKEKDKVDLIQIEKEFYLTLEENGIDESKIIFNTSGYYWYYWWSYRHEYHKQKRFTVSLDKSTNFLGLMKDLDTDGVSSIRISNTSNTNLQTLRKEVKVKAVQAAREKATYLLESIDEKVGRVISIEEVPEQSNPYYWARNADQLSNVVVSSNRSGNEFENISTIKLRYEIKAKFGID